MDKIFMNKLTFYGYHGAYREENKLGQRFYVDLIMEADLKKAGMSDDINDTVDYSQAYQIVENIVTGKPRKLVERLAEEIADTVLANFPIVEQVTVKVVKPNPPIAGQYDSVAVAISRGRS